MRRLGLACAAIIALSACDRSPTPIEPTADRSAAASNSPDKPRTTAKPPKLPAAAKTNDATGAANFVVYWVKLFNRASHTGDTETLMAFTDDSCAGCRSYVELYEKTYADGGYFRGSDWTLSDVSVEEGVDESLVLAHVSAPEGEFRLTASSAVRRGNDENSNLAFGVRWTAQGWRLSQLGFQDEVVR